MNSFKPGLVEYVLAQYLGAEAGGSVCIELGLHTQLQASLGCILSPNVSKQQTNQIRSYNKAREERVSLVNK